MRAKQGSLNKLNRDRYMEAKMQERKRIQEELNKALPANAIELRVGSPDKENKKVTVLFYKDARVDANRLDSIVGAFGWKREHYSVDGVNYCTVSIQDPVTGEWISKSDAGSESKAQAEKGEASDAFKRACFQWGIGRELYDMPVVKVDEKYKFRLNFVNIKLAYFEGTKTVAALILTYGNDIIFKYTHQDYKKDSKVYIV